MKFKSTFIKVFVLLIIALFTVTCGQKKKGLALLEVSPEKTESYTEGFKRYFELIGDTSKNPRYKIIINGTGSESLDGCFLINVTDNGIKTISVNFKYTVGAKHENATVINPNLISGKMEVNKNIVVTLNEDGKKSREHKIAEAIYLQLLELEGK